MYIYIYLYLYTYTQIARQMNRCLYIYIYICMYKYVRVENIEALPPGCSKQKMVWRGMGPGCFMLRHLGFEGSRVLGFEGFRV